MSNTIDERVVEMRFDNQDFEKNVKTSMSTLEKLKQSLNLSGSAKSLESIDSAARKVDMGTLGNGVESVKLKFSALEVMAVAALTNITNSAVNAGKQLVKSLTVDQLAAGFQKYEQKTASVQTIMNATGKSIEEVSGYLDKLMWYSDETSYGFTDMTSALATMTSSGGDIDKLIPMIEGVANATAFAGKGANEFSRVMQYAINQAYSLGYMQTQDWKTIEGATVNSKQLIQYLIKAGEELNTIKEGQVTIENFRSTLSDKWLTSDVMEKGFGEFAKVTEAIYEGIQNGTFESYAEGLAAIGDSYGDVALKAAKSAQEAKTFTEAVDATKDAVSSSFMRMAEMIFGDYEQATALWTEVCNGLFEAFAQPLNSFEEILAPALGSKWDDFTSAITDTGVAMEDFQSKASEVLSSHGVSLDDLIAEYGSLEKAIASGEISAGTISETFRALADTTTTTTKSSEELNAELQDMRHLLREIWNGDWGNGQTRIDKLTAAGYDAAKVQELVNKVTADYVLTVEDLGYTQEETTKYTEEQIAALKDLAEQAGMSDSEISKLIDSLSKPSGRELLIDSVRNALSALSQAIGAVKEAWYNIFPAKTSEDLYNAIESIHSFTEKLKLSEDTINKIKSSFEGLFSILKVVSKVMGGVLRTGLNVLSNLLGLVGGNVLDITSSLGESVKEWIDNNEVIEKVTKAFDKLNSAISNAFEYLDKFVAFVKKSLSPAFTGAKEAIGNLVAKIKESEAFKEVSEKFGEAIQKVRGALDDLKERIDNFDFSGLTEKFNSVVSFFSGLGTTIANSKIGSAVIDGLVGAFNKLKNIKLPKLDFESFMKKLNNFTTFLQDNNYTGVAGTITGAFGFFKSKLTTILDTKKNATIQKFSEFWLKNGDGIVSGFRAFRNVISELVTNVFGALNENLPHIIDM